MNLIKLQQRQSKAIGGIVLRLTDSQLENQNAVGNVLKEVEYKMPVLELGKKQTKIDTQTFGWGQGPIGITYTPGEPLNRASFIIPILGDYSEIQGQLSNSVFVKDSNLYYSDYYSEPIIGNDGLINSINERAKRELTSIHERLESNRHEMEAFTQNILKPQIENAIANELEKRSIKKKSEGQLGHW